MTNSARDKINEYIKDLRDTQGAIDELEDASRKNYGGDLEYAFRVLSMALVEAISELPKSRRDEMRGSLLDLAQKERSEYAAKQIKDSDIQKIFDPAGVLK